MQYFLIAFSDAVVIWCIYAKILLDMALASSDANALTYTLHASKSLKWLDFNKYYLFYFFTPFYTPSIIVCHVFDFFFFYHSKLWLLYKKKKMTSYDWWNIKWNTSKFITLIWILWYFFYITGNRVVPKIIFFWSEMNFFKNQVKFEFEMFIGRTQ